MQGVTVRIGLARVLALAWLAVTCQTALADLGETEAELVKRYGKPTEVVGRSPDIAPAEKILRFKTRDFHVSVAMLKNRSAAEHYTFGQAISGPDDKRVDSVLKAHVGDGPIMPAPDPSLIGEDYKYVWVIVRGKAGTSSAAVRKDNLNKLELQTNEYTKLLR